MQIGDLVRFKEDAMEIVVKFERENFTRHLFTASPSIYLLLDIQNFESKVIYSKNPTSMGPFWVQTKHLKKL